MNLKDRVALVTGGTGNLGSVVVARLLEAGVRVRVTYVDESYDRLRTDLGAPAALSGAKVDLADASAVTAMTATAARELGRLDCLIALAGGFEWKPFLETELADVRRMMDLNFATLFNPARAAFPIFQAHKRGAIIAVGSRSGVQSDVGLAAYAASKAAVISLSQTLAVEGRPHGIRSYCLLPSTLDTPANRRAMPDADPSRWVAPSSIADTIAFLCADDRGDLSGAAIPVYGGS
jgi:NAD(P)-dependent dehydrogenase (short-subunit alcohol dehydrogenase family)